MSNGILGGIRQPVRIAGLHRRRKADRQRALRRRRRRRNREPSWSAVLSSIHSFHLRNLYHTYA